ncbi:MAG: hypothetical protein ACTSPB_16885 [Candidatus Thorarchaeota archaeon]
MEVSIQKREKVNACDIAVGKCFKFVAGDKCFQRVDLSGEAVFKDILKDDVIYCVEMATGRVVILDPALTVERIDLTAVEMGAD